MKDLDRTVVAAGSGCRCRGGSLLRHLQSEFVTVQNSTAPSEGSLAKRRYTFAI
jgi:hypothetical protein